jgi:integrative and conjugative element protein (TIGR02256 family)
MIEYRIGSSEQTLVLMDEVLEHFRRHRQIRFWQCEAGGQLFARYESNRIIVVEATGPRRTDRRSRGSYVPDRRAEQEEIERRSLIGLQFIGDWHSHPEPRPKPSRLDLASIAECFNRSAHTLNAFVMAIVGQIDAPEGLHVLLHDGLSSYVLTPMHGQT